MIDERLFDRITAEFEISLHGIHGLAHWQRVCANGLRLAASTGADAQVVELFAFLHDVKRRDNGFDRGHGPRAAAWIEALQEGYLALAAPDLEDLVYACRYHSDGLVEANVTVQTCWDADRLDLGRIGIRPNARYLCTPAAREPAMIAWAYAQSRHRAEERSTSEQAPPSSSG